MSEPTTITSAAEPVRANRAAAALEIALILAVFCVDAGWPVPDVNEVYYLGKARHFWNPQWCQGDFFLGTADAHYVFYVTFGWLSLFLPLPALAWVGRLLTWGLMAWAWRRLSFTVMPKVGYAVLSAALFVMLSERCQMAGEWVVGGVESKGFAYVLVFLAMESLVRNRWNRAWLLLGAATAMHVLVGGWSVVAAGIAWLLAPRDRPTLVSMLPALVVCAVLSLAGILPALMMNVGVDRAVVQEANLIQVYQRLPHHLLSDEFPDAFIPRHVAMCFLWLVLWTVLRGETALQRLNRFVAGAVAIAVAGFFIQAITRHNPPLAAEILRLYWFRLSDAILPIGTALSAICYIRSLAVSRPKLALAWLFAAAIMSGIHLLDNGLDIAAAYRDRPRADRRNVHYQDWRDVCQWVAEHSDPNDLFFTPRLSATFKWYARRGEVVNWKDLPQDANAVVEWWRRINEIYGPPVVANDASLSDEERLRIRMMTPPDDVEWRPTLASLGDDELSKLARKYKVDYVVLQLLPNEPTLAMQPVYRNNSYAVYKLSGESRE